MRSPKVFAAVFLTAMAASGAFAAGRPADPGVPPHLFTIDKTVRSAASSRWLLPDAAEEFSIQASPAAVAANPAAFTVDLPDLPLLEAVRTRFVEYAPDWKSWIGTLRYAGEQGKGEGYIHLAYHGDRVTALIEFEGQRFRIAGANEEGGQRLTRLSEDLSPMSCGMDKRADGPPMFGNDLLDSIDQATAPSAVSEKPLISPLLATYQIDLLAVYPRAYFALGPAAQTALRNFIQDSVSLANDQFLNSQIDAAYNLKGVVPLTGSAQPSNGSIFNVLTWLTTQINQASQPTEVTNLRNAYGADVVTLYIPWTWNTTDVCGVANMYRSSTSYFRGNGTVNSCVDTLGNPVACDLAHVALSVNRDGCGLSDHTLGHEIGHNYGMWHDTPLTSSVAFPNGNGHILTYNSRHYASVMGCFCTGCRCTNTCQLGSGAICNRIPYFSDPNILYQGSVPTGTANRNNAAVGRAQVPSYSAIRSPIMNTPPTANFTVGCMGRTCSFNGTSSTDNSGISSYWWDFGDGSAPQTGANVNHTFPATGISFPVHLVVNDNGLHGGQRSVKSLIVEPQTAPIYEGYHEVANCSTISGWAWDQNQPNTAINVSLDRDTTHITTIAANLHRQDLVNAGKGNGYHAFVFNVDDTWKDGVSHSVRVRFNNTATNLTWTPRTILCGVTALTNQAPLNSASTGGIVYTVATQFSSSANGTITHLGFYRAPGETGTNTAYLWSNAGGAPLGQVTLPSSGTYPSGWVWGKLTTPVSITAGTLYRVGVNTNTQQAKTNCGLSGGTTNHHLTAHQGFWLAGNGVFPTTSSCSNFFVDVKFDPQ